MQNKPITRSVSTSSMNCDGNTSKRLRDDFPHPSCVEHDCSDLLSKIQRMFEDSNAKIEGKIDSSISRVEHRISDVEKQLSTFQSECTGNINKLFSAVTEVRVGLSSTSQRLDRIEKRNDLLISGVPYVGNENLQQLFRNLATSLKFNASDTPLVDLKRLMRPPIAIGSTPLIVCQFAFKNARDEFYSRYLKTRSLSLRNVGFDSDARVYLNENLTPQARTIRSEAIKMKKKGMLLKVFTRNGVVYVQRGLETGAEPINEANQLKIRSSCNLSS